MKNFIKSLDLKLTLSSIIQSNNEKEENSDVLEIKKLLPKNIIKKASQK